jgi:hypothetical protein
MIKRYIEIGLQREFNSYPPLLRIKQYYASSTNNTDDSPFRSLISGVKNRLSLTSWYAWRIEYAV